MGRMRLLPDTGRVDGFISHWAACMGVLFVCVRVSGCSMSYKRKKKNTSSVCRIYPSPSVPWRSTTRHEYSTELPGQKPCLIKSANTRSTSYAAMYRSDLLRHGDLKDALGHVSLRGGALLFQHQLFHNLRMHAYIYIYIYTYMCVCV